MTPDPAEPDAPRCTDGQLPVAQPVFDAPDGFRVPLARPVALPPIAHPVPPPHPMLLAAESRWACLADLALFLAPFTMLALIGYALARASGALGDWNANLHDAAASQPAPTSEDVTLMFVGTIVVGLAALAVIGFILLIRRQRSPAVGVSAGALGWNLLLGPAVCLAAFMAFFLTNIIVVAINPGLIERLQANTEKLTELIPRLPPVVLGAAMMCVGFYEEVIFRGFLLPRLRRMTGSWAVAIVLSSALFAAAHIGSQETVMVAHLFLLGIVFSVTTAWRRSVIPSIVGHGLFNFVQILALYYMELPGSARGAS